MRSRGWEGLTHVDLNDPASKAHYILPLNRENTRTIDRSGGTFLPSSRTNPTEMKDLPPALRVQKFEAKETIKNGVTSTAFDVTPTVLKNIDTLELDYLIAIGGDDTLSYASELDRNGIKANAVPKTMDNDVRNTEYCIGFSTVDLTHLIDLLINDKRENSSNYSIAVLSEGAEWQGYTLKEYGEADGFGHRKKMSVAEDLREEIRRATGEEAVVSDLTCDLRSGSPDFVDRLVAFIFACMAMDALEESKSGLMTAINEGRYAMVPIPDSNLGPRKADVASMYDTERYCPKYTDKTGLPLFLTRPW